MHYKAFLCFTFLGSSTAQSISSRSQYARLHSLASESHYATLGPQDIATLVNIKSALRHGTEGVNAVNTAIKGITTSNAKQQLGTVNNALQKLSSDVSADMKKLKASGAIGIGEILGLLQEAPRNELLKDILDLVVAFNGTFTEMGNKRNIVKDSKALVDIVAPGIKSLRQGLLDIVSIVPSQVPTIAKGPIDSIVASLVAKSGGAPPAGADAPAALSPEPAPKGKGGAGKGGAGKGGAPKGGAGKGSTAKGSSSSGVTLTSLLTSPESLEAMGKGLDGILDQVIAYLRGTVNQIIPAEIVEAIFPTGPPEGIPRALIGPKKASA